MTSGKKKLVEKIDAQMDALNERWTDHFSNVTDRLEVIVVKIEERTAQAETRGRDGSGVKMRLPMQRARSPQAVPRLRHRQGRRTVLR